MTNHNENTLILRMRDTIREIAEHDHDTAPVSDIHCLNLKAWMGEHMVHVLRILDEAQSEVDSLVARNRALADDTERLISKERTHRCDHDCPPVGVGGSVPTGEIYQPSACVHCDGVGCSHCNYGGI